MPMPSYPIYCHTPGCKHLAAYKIAALWSDGRQSELKTYGLCCEECLPKWFERGREKQKECRLTAGETLETPGIWAMRHGERDKRLERLEDLEQKFANG